MERSLSVLDTEKVNPATTQIDRMSPLEIVQVIAEHAQHWYDDPARENLRQPDGRRTGH